MSKRWFVAAKVPDYINGCFVWKKCYGDINKHKNVAERLEECNKLDKQIETTQLIPVNQGSRKSAIAVDQQFYTDVLFQVIRFIENEKEFSFVALKD